jgi:hypothetical protein
MNLTENIRPKIVMDICKIIRTEKLQELFPYVNIVLRIYLCCPTFNCSAEISFSALKRDKSVIYLFVLKMFLFLIITPYQN